MVPGGAGCLSKEAEEEAEGFVEKEWVPFCSPPRPWRYDITPAADTTTVALWVDNGTDSCPNSVRGEERERNEQTENERKEEDIGRR